MVSKALRAALVATTLALVGANESRITALGKVIQMLENMAAKGAKDKEDEKVAFGKFTSWCNAQIKAKTTDVTTDKERVDKSTANLAKAKADIQTFGSNIQEGNVKREKTSAELAKAKVVREKQVADYQRSLADFMESEDAINGAMTALKAGRKGQARSLLQADRFASVHKSLKVLLLEAEAAPTSTALVLQMLDKLKENFAQQRAKLIEEEKKAKTGYDTLLVQLGQSLELTNKEITTKTASLSEAQEAQATSKGKLADSSKDLKDNTKFLQDTQTMCQMKAKDFEERQQMRGQELLAIQKAVDILKSKVASKSAMLLQLQSSVGTSLAQLRTNQAKLKMGLQDFLESQSEALNSEVLLELAQQAAADPLAKVKEMITGMIKRLEAKADEEANHKAWCDSEFKTTKATQDDKKARVAKISAEVEGIKAKSAKLQMDIKELGQRLVQIDSARSKATAERDQSKKKNEETIKTAKECQEGVQEATAVLRKFYNAPALLQVAQAPQGAPPTFDGPYQGVSPGGGNVLDFMQIILADYAKLQAETEAQESTEAKAYSKFMEDSQTDKALKTQEQKLKEDTIAQEKSNLQTTSEELQEEQEGLKKADAYSEKLKSSCGGAPVDPEEISKKRQAEIKALEEALKLFEAPAAA